MVLLGCSYLCDPDVELFDLDARLSNPEKRIAAVMLTAIGGALFAWLK